MAVASSRVDQIDEVMDLLSCFICFEYFNNPKLLPCGHYFCCPCLEKFVDAQRVNKTKDSSDADKFPCPSCTSEFSLKPHELVADLPSNEFLRNVLQACQRKQKENAAVCSLCDKPALTVCQECEKLLCKACLLEHSTSFEFHTHKVQSLSEMLERDRRDEIGAERIRCILHTTMPTYFYCEKCKELICLRCLSNEGKIYVHTKPDHVCVGAHEIDSKVRETLKLNYDDIDAKLTEGKHALQVVENGKKCHTDNADRLKLQIRTQRDKVLADFTEILNEKAEEIISLISQEYDPVIGKLESQRKQISEYVKKVECACEKTKYVLEMRNIAELLDAWEEYGDDATMKNEREKNMPPEPCVVEDFSESLMIAEIDACDVLRELLAIEELCKNSVIMRGARELVKYLRDFVGKEFVWTLCYRASRHNWKALDFHNKCDNKTPTVILVNVGENIFGGYADQNWQGQHVQKYSVGCFLFSLRNKPKLPPFKCPIIEGKYDSAICCNPECGAIFGPLGPDLLISDKAYANELSCSNLGKIYQAPPGYEFGKPETQSLLAGSFNFKPDEIEVFCSN